MDTPIQGLYQSREIVYVYVNGKHFRVKPLGRNLNKTNKTKEP